MMSLNRIKIWYFQNQKEVYLGIALILFGIILGHIFLNNHLVYEPVILTKNVELNNSNAFEVETYVSVNCSEGVEVNLYEDSYYISTWENDKTSYGVCEIKYVEVVPRLK